MHVVSSGNMCSMWANEIKWHCHTTLIHINDGVSEVPELVGVFPRMVHITKHGQVRQKLYLSYYAQYNIV